MIWSDRNITYRIRLDHIQWERIGSEHNELDWTGTEQIGELESILIQQSQHTLFNNYLKSIPLYIFNLPQYLIHSLDLVYCIVMFH